MARRPLNLPAPYLRRIWLDPDRVPDRKRYPFGMTAFHDAFELSFPKPVDYAADPHGFVRQALAGSELEDE